MKFRLLVTLIFIILLFIVCSIATIRGNSSNNLAIVNDCKLDTTKIIIKQNK